VRLPAQPAVIGAVAALIVLAAAALGCGGSAGVHNAGIVWGYGQVIEGANVDGSAGIS
jgi:hypothetical protein